jgi:hypothetical protein
MTSSRTKLGVVTLVVLAGTVVLVVGVPVVGLSTACVSVESAGTVVEKQCRESVLPSWSSAATLVLGAVLLVGGQWSFWRTPGGTGRASEIVADAVILACGLAVAFVYGAWLWNLVTFGTATVELAHAVVAALALLGVALVVTGGRELWTNARARW